MQPFKQIQRRNCFVCRMCENCTSDIAVVFKSVIICLMFHCSPDVTGNMQKGIWVPDLAPVPSAMWSKRDNCGSLPLPAQLSITRQPAHWRSEWHCSHLTKPSEQRYKTWLDLNAASFSLSLSVSLFLPLFCPSLSLSLLFVVRAPEAVERRVQASQQSYWSITPLSSPPSLPSLPLSLPLFRPCCVFGSYYWPSWTSLPIFVKTGTYGSWSAICHTEYFLAVSPICIIAGSGIKVAHY